MFRNPKYVERYEDVVFELETPLNTVVANNRYKKKKMAIDLLLILQAKLYLLIGITQES